MPNARFISDIKPSAKFMIDLAEEKFKNSEFENVASFEPFYLKDFMILNRKKVNSEIH